MPELVLRSEREGRRSSATVLLRRLPQLISLKKDVEQGDEFAHCRNKSDLWLFAGLAKPMMEGFDRRLEPDGGEGCHIERAPHAGPTAPNMTFATMLPGIPIDGSDADKGRGLFGADVAEFRQFGKNDGGCEGSDSWHADEDIATLDELRIGIKCKSDCRIDASELTFECRKALLDPFSDHPLGMLETVLLGNHHIDELAPARHQGPQSFPSGSGRKRSRLHDRAEQGDRLGIDCIGFGKLASCPRQVAHLPWIDHRNRDIGALKCTYEGDLVTTSGFSNDQLGRISAQILDKLTDSGRRIGIPHRSAALTTRSVQVSFGDIDADDHDQLLLAIRALGPCNRSSEQIAAEELAEARAERPRMTRSAAAAGRYQ
jgi:hypothetical protein